MKTVQRRSGQRRHRRSDWEIFKDKYAPIKNHLDKNANLDGYMFETYGAENEFVKQQDPLKIWTYLEGYNGRLYIVQGWHYVNRLGYLIASVPYKEGDRVEYRY